MADTSALDMQDLMLELQAELGEAVEEFMNELQQPHIMNALRAGFASIPPDRKEWMKQTYPDLYNHVAQVAQK